MIGTEEILQKQQHESADGPPKDLEKQRLCHILCIHRPLVLHGFPGAFATDQTMQRIYSTYHTETRSPDSDFDVQYVSVYVLPDRLL